MENPVQVRLNPEIVGWRSDKKPDKDLMEDIKKNTQVEAITARKLPDGTLEIISGNRRYAAMLEDGISPENMKITVLENVSDEDAVVMAIAGNRFRKDFTAIEEARAFNTLREMKWTVKKIAARLNHSETFVKERLDMLELPKTIQEKIVAGKLEPSYAASINKLKDYPDAQLELANKITDKRGYRDISTVKQADEFVTKVIKDKERREQLAAQYGPCPKCGGNNLDKAEWGDKNKLVCLNPKCKHEWDAETKDPWPLYQLKRDAKTLGLDLEVQTPGEAKLTPMEVTQLIAERTEKNEGEEAGSPNFRSNHTVSELLLPFVTEDNVLTMDVNDDDITLKLIAGTDLHFKVITKPYKSGEKSRIMTSTYYGSGKETEKVRKYNETLQASPK